MNFSLGNSQSAFVLQESPSGVVEALPFPSVQEPEVHSSLLFIPVLFPLESLQTPSNKHFNQFLFGLSKMGILTNSVTQSANKLKLAIKLDQKC